MNNFIEQNVSLEKCPALVLNADYRPLSYYPLSLWSWQDTVKSVFLDRVIIVSNYDRIIRSPSFNMQLPSVIALKDYIVPQSKPSFTRLSIRSLDAILDLGIIKCIFVSIFRLMKSVNSLEFLALAQIDTVTPLIKHALAVPSPIANHCIRLRSLFCFAISMAHFAANGEVKIR